MNWKCKLGRHDWVIVDREEEITFKLTEHLKSIGFKLVKSKKYDYYTNGVIEIPADGFRKNCLYNFVHAFNIYSKVCVRCMKVKSAPISYFIDNMVYEINEYTENIQRKQFAQRVLSDHVYLEENKRKEK